MYYAEGNNFFFQFYLDDGRENESLSPIQILLHANERLLLFQCEENNGPEVQNLCLDCGEWRSRVENNSEGKRP